MSAAPTPKPVTIVLLMIAGAVGVAFVAAIDAPRVSHAAAIWEVDSVPPVAPCDNCQASGRAMGRAALAMDRASRRHSAPPYLPPPPGSAILRE